MARLRLNRPPLIALRLSRREVKQLRENVVNVQMEQARLSSRLAALEHELEAIMAQIARLLES
jgi:hypothetical protein